MKHRLLENVAVALVVVAVAVPFANAATSYDGYKSSYPQLHQMHQMQQRNVAATTSYDGYKSGYPELHATLAHQAHAPLVRTTDGAFHWSDAAIGAGTAAAAIFLIAASALVISRRHTRLAL